jgi:Rrf2 family iron-sulfur cluster assembly transcriptional regulator
VRLSTRGRYAVMAMVDLATQERESCPGPVALAGIAGRQQLSLAYLEQLFGKLRRAGLVVSVRGPGGGYRLARSAGAIFMSDIIVAVEEKLHTTRCVDGGPGCLDRKGDTPHRRCQTHALWHELGVQIRRFLSAVTLADVMEERVAECAARCLGNVTPAGVEARVGASAIS